MERFTDLPLQLDQHLGTVTKQYKHQDISVNTVMETSLSQAKTADVEEIAFETS